MQYRDGSTSCNCKGWTRRVAADGSRSCKHTRYVDIWEIQIANYGCDPKDFDTVQLGRATEGLTGSEIENVFIEAMYLAFDANKEPTDLHIAQVLTEFVPLSKLMAEQITGLRQWANGRARLARSQTSKRKLRRIAA